MSVVDKRLCKGILDSANGTLYTVPTLTMTLVKAITICNTANVTHAFTIVFAGVEVIFTHSIQAYNTLTIPFLDQILDAGELIEGDADTAGVVTYYISGKEVT